MTTKPMDAEALLEHIEGWLRRPDDRDDDEGFLLAAATDWIKARPLVEVAAWRAAIEHLARELSWDASPTTADVASANYRAKTRHAVQSAPALFADAVIAAALNAATGGA